MPVIVYLSILYPPPTYEKLHNLTIYLNINLFISDASGGKTRQMSIETEIQSAYGKAKTKSSYAKSQHWLDSSTDMSDSDLDFSVKEWSENPTKSMSVRPQKFKNAFATYKLATANKMHIGK